ncbi:MAG: hypothetical protein HN454_04685 [Gammaproteobacteria bacterium]|nr:hypothetical protein [Gammaproteobacteria bacterium]
MNEKTLRALIEAGAVKRIDIVAQGNRFHVDAITPDGSLTVVTLKGTIKGWSSLDSTAKWVRSLGMGKAQLDLVNWQPEQKGLRL